MDQNLYTDILIYLECQKLSRKLAKWEGTDEDDIFKKIKMPCPKELQFSYKYIKVRSDLLSFVMNMGAFIDQKKKVQKRKDLEAN